MTTNDPNIIGKTWELSLYELHRQPQDVITDGSEIAVSPRSLHSELMCPICLDMLKNTMTTKECLHRFCQDCIITALRSGNKECPTCRKKLVSKRSLRADPNFDMLIARIYPSREDYEAQQERVIAKVNQHKMSHHIEEALRIQAANRARNQNIKKQTDDDTELRPIPHTPSTPGGSSAANGDVEESDDADGPWDDPGQAVAEVELVIKPLPQADRTDPSLNAIRFLKTAVSATIDHIAKYLEMRYDFECKVEEQQQAAAVAAGTNGHTETNGAPTENGGAHPKKPLHPFSIYIASGPGQYNPIPGSMNLDLVLEKHWKVNKPLELFYAYKVNKPVTNEGGKNGSTSKIW